MCIAKENPESGIPVLNVEEAYVQTGGHLVAGAVIFHGLGRCVWGFR